MLISKYGKGSNASATILIDPADLADNNSWHSPVIQIKVLDKENNRWTDLWVDVNVVHGRIKFGIHHDKGYPSEQKGTIHKSVTANWLSNELPKLD